MTEHKGKLKARKKEGELSAEDAGFTTHIEKGGIGKGDIRSQNNMENGGRKNGDAMRKPRCPEKII